MRSDTSLSSKRTGIDPTTVSVSSHPTLSFSLIGVKKKMSECSKEGGLGVSCPRRFRYFAGRYCHGPQEVGSGDAHCSIPWYALVCRFLLGLSFLLSFSFLVSLLPSTGLQRFWAS